MLACVALSCASSAAAQDETFFDAGKNQSVRERARPEYEAIGVRAGAFILYPTVEVDSVFVDNVLAEATNTKSDLSLRIKPSLEISSDWARHAFDAEVDLVRNQYMRLTDESVTDLTANVSGQIDISRASIARFRLTSALLSEPRTADTGPDLLEKPLRFGSSSADLSLRHEVGRLRVSGGVTYVSSNYKDAKGVSGDLIDEDYRDNRRWSSLERIDYAFRPGLVAFVTGSANVRKYPNGEFEILAQDSFGYEVGTGLKLDVTHLVRGEVQAGYLKQNYKSPLFGSVGGVSFRGRLEWFPTPLITVTADARRSLEDSAQIGQSGFLLSTMGLQVDHELLRNLILTARAQSDHATFSGTDRRDSYKTAEVRATLLLNRSVGAGLSYQRVSRSSSGSGAIGNFTVNVVNLSLVIQR